MTAKIKMAAGILTGILATGLLFGCGASKDTSGSGGTTEAAADAGGTVQEAAGTTETAEKETVTIALWANQLLENYAPWLQEQFPDVEMDFYIITNSTDYYKFRAENDELPDIMTVRRFSLRDVEPIKDLLLDLSDTELANNFYQSYLRSYTYEDGVVNWLPACAEVDDMIVNKTLFEENDIPLPTDYESFVYACQEFEKLGIQGFVTDYCQDYTCMEVLQGLSIAQLSSAEGRQWRKSYESGSTDGLSEDVWLPVFEKMEQFITDLGLDASSLDVTTSDVLNGFDEGKIAMYRGTGADLTSWGDDYEKIMMAYPGDSEEESWYLTYPAFQVAASADAAESEERQALILDIMTAMLSEDGLKHISEGQNMIAYNKDVTLDLIPEFDNLPSYIEENRIYIRLASSDMFSVSKDVVQKMLTGEISGAQAAYDEFDRQMTETDDSEDEIAATIETGYSRKFVSGKGNEAASAVYNSLREELGADLVIGQSAVVAGDILAGDYTEAELSYLIGTGGAKLLSMNLTGEEIVKLVQYMLDVKGSRDSVANDSTLLTSGGFAMTLSRTEDGGYQVEALTADGEELGKDTTYSIVVNVTYETDITGFEEAGFTDYEILDGDLKELLTDRLLSGKQLCEPTAYITIE